MLKIKGWKTIIFNALTGLVLVADFFTGEVHEFFCNNLNTACEATFWATAASVSVAINTVLRFLTDTPVGSSQAK